MDLVELFCMVDDFVKTLKNDDVYEISYIKNGSIKEPTHRGGKPRMSLSELMTILIAYHSSNFKNFKAYYCFLCIYQRHDFPKILSYTRFLDWVPFCLIPLTQYLKSQCGAVTGISFIDSTKIQVCKNIRISRNKVFEGTGARGKSSMGWFFGFNLHIIVNEIGELLAFKLTKRTVDDRAPVKDLCKKIKGKLFGDKGYLSAKLFEELWGGGIQLITGIRNNMKNKFIDLTDKILLRKRFLIETINDQLKNISDIEHSRHRSPVNFLVNLVCGLISYTHQKRKPSIKWGKNSICLT